MLTFPLSQSRDSSATYIHLASSRYADLFEEFCRPPSLTANTNAASSQPTGNVTLTSASGPSNDPATGMITLPGIQLPFEEIHLPPDLQPLNPEDEDDVVPDMHAAFGINRALGQNQGGNRGESSNAGAATGGAEGEASTVGVQREAAWRDLGLERLLGDTGTGSEGRATNGSVTGSKLGSRREGKRTGLLFMR